VARLLGRTGPISNSWNGLSAAIILSWEGFVELGGETACFDHVRPRIVMLSYRKLSGKHCLHVRRLAGHEHDGAVHNLRYQPKISILIFQISPREWQRKTWDPPSS
jgi:hypothetical protein